MRRPKLLPLFLALLSLSAGALAQSSDRDKAFELYHQAKYAEAAALLETIVENDKKDRKAILFLGGSYVHLKEHNRAVKAFRRTEFRVKDASAEYSRELKVIRKRPATYTEAARQNNTSGTIKIAVEFLADGTIGFEFPYQTLPDGLTQNAAHEARQIKFEPAMKNGVPVTVITTITYDFSIY